ncbi:sentrin-specific protease 7-like isoform X2 [Kryptolebias marmoratus]|uniref:sentrin-specific protease 7-like isoform X2 n=1 Tax=Kryptolebias marmoratus TaxID=37003 RepID=UPI0018ACE03D|nr:sentrin-specific protease 7-like isoform X2 [Kryptolebias marmoratus]
MEQLVKLQMFAVAAGGAERTVGELSISLRSLQPPECTEQGCDRTTVTKSYLQVEWEVRRKTPRLFSCDSMRSCSCRVPQQDNSSDCGLYLLQYVESFLQNPVVHFDLPLRLESWFPRQRVRQKREEIRTLILRLHQNQRNKENHKTSPSR